MTTQARTDFQTIYGIAPADQTLRNPLFVKTLFGIVGDQDSAVTIAETYFGISPGSVYTTSADFIRSLHNQAVQFGLVSEAGAEGDRIRAAITSIYPEITDFSSPQALSTVSGQPAKLLLQLMSDPNFNATNFANLAPKVIALNNDMTT